MKSYSQFGQDLAVRSLLPGDRGIFVDVGASDGEFLSNTLSFEEAGWAGLCIEPDPAEFDSLLDHRTCACENVACADQRGQLDFQRVPVRGWSGLVDYPHEENQAEIAVMEREVFRVPAVPLQDLLDKYQLALVNYLSIDVEGAEFAVLSGIDWARVAITAITVEITSRESPVLPYLLERGYALWDILVCDHLYVSREWLRNGPAENL